MSLAILQIVLLIFLKKALLIAIMIQTKYKILPSLTAEQDAYDITYYITATNYASALNNIIVSDGLTNWNKEAFNESDYPHKAVDVSIITIKTVQNPGVFAYNSNGNAVSESNNVFINGSKWKAAGTKVINNQEMFEVATNEYVPIKDTTVGANGVITINYTSGYGVMGYHLNGSPISGSNSTFKTGTSWATDEAAVINGEVMYRVATDEYIPKEYTQFENGK